MTKEKALLKIQELQDYVNGQKNYKSLEMIDFVDCEKPFKIAKYLVTQELWETIMGNNPSHFKGNNLPVECVSWNDVQDFIKKLNHIVKKNYRLPTEYEWMLAAFVDNTIYSGSDNHDEVSWNYKNSNGSTHPVGLKKPNSLGIYDMSGNVHEWCQDQFTRYTQNNNLNSIRCITRGGSWLFNPLFCRAAHRINWSPTYRYCTLGFRLAI